MAMKTFLFSRSFILTTILAIAICAMSMVAFQKTAVVCQNANQSYSKGSSSLSGEILWDKMAKHLVNLIFI
jgi:hypothetical protein